MKNSLEDIMLQQVKDRGRDIKNDKTVISRNMKKLGLCEGLENTHNKAEQIPPIDLVRKIVQFVCVLSCRKTFVTVFKTIADDVAISVKQKARPFVRFQEVVHR